MASGQCRLQSQVPESLMVMTGRQWIIVTKRGLSLVRELDLVLFQA